MMEVLEKWYRRYLFEESSILLLVLLLISVALLMTIGDILVPLLASLVLAYLMQGVANLLQRSGLPPRLSVALTYLIFVGAFFTITLLLLPLAWRQLVSLAGELPRMFDQGRQLLVILPERYPELISANQVNQFVTAAQGELAGVGQRIVTWSLAGIPGLFIIMVYMILIPLLVFFFLKDRETLTQWFVSMLPAERPLLNRIWREMDQQVSNYARGKVVEVLIVGVVSYLAFTWLNLNYTALLALLVGLSVIIPYVGATLVTLPVVAVGFFQFDLTSEFY